MYGHAQVLANAGALLISGFKNSVGNIVRCLLCKSSFNRDSYRKQHSETFESVYLVDIEFTV